MRLKLKVVKEDFSVLMALYNGEQESYLQFAFSSLFEQTLKPTEVILVIDGPIRSSLEDVISYWKEKLHVNIIRLAENKGLSVALNVGLSSCTNDLVARMDTDDICKPTRFESQVSFMNRNVDVDICGTFCTVISESGVEYDKLQVPCDDDTIKKLIWTCPIVHPTVIFRKESIIKIGSYSKNVPRRQDDYELWIRAAMQNLTFANIPKYLLEYRLAMEKKTKNSLDVAFNRFAIGLPAVIRFDLRVLSLVGLMYPIVRACLPVKLSHYLQKIVRKIDPRKKY
ncbi:hypothetical protein BCT86_14455 [Vibrio breoganii]|nr:hypothetical protein BCT86_14455 [Vibrio breoganii]